MAEVYDVAFRVVSQMGTCDAGHKVGDRWVSNGKTPEGMCAVAYNAMLPFYCTLAYGGTFPWETDSDMTTVACPDAQNPVVFELRRLRK